MGIKITVNDGKQQKLYYLEESLTIGRSSKNDIILKGHKVSKEHALLYRDHDGKVFIQDLKSTNGTVLNGLLEETEQVMLGDSILIWDIEIQIFDQDLSISEKKKIGRRNKAQLISLELDKPSLIKPKVTLDKKTSVTTKKKT